jgi:hypothetical protein
VFFWFFVLFYLSLFCEKSSYLCGPGCSQTHYVAQVGHELLLLLPQPLSAGITGVAHYAWIFHCCYL